ncbi:hypothetical protein [uncultured Bdellovibrio sp.]|uniref:hypothetical protein n=1 Tax=Bdellovibrio sp. HCB-162 TaxID=3394234 RepID=UPI0025DEF994|nr:hypothetical protein [uncultured Bdellovibrio sp.]
MKNMIMAAALLLSVSAQANDQYVPVIKCQGNGVALTVSEGGFTGIPMIQIDREEEGVTSSENHLARLVRAEGRMGAPATYVGKKITFTINFTTSPGPDGTRKGTLYNKETKKSETLVCKRVK